MGFNFNLTPPATGGGGGALTTDSVLTTHILNKNVTLEKIQDIPQNTIVGRIANGTGVATTLTANELSNLIGVDDNAITPHPNVDMTGVGDSRVGFAQMLLDNAGTVIQLAPGTIRIGGSVGGGIYGGNGGIIVPAGTTLVGHRDRTTILCTDPLYTQNYLILKSNVTLKNLDIQCDPNATALRDANSQVVTAILECDIKLTDVRIFGAGLLQNKIERQNHNLLLHGCDRVDLLRVSLCYSLGNGYGVQFIGCKDCTIYDCVVNDNGWDGMKTSSGQWTETGTFADSQWTVSFANATNTVTRVGGGATSVLFNGEGISFMGIMPTGLEANREYFAIEVSGNNFKLAKTRGSTVPVDFHTDGSAPAGAVISCNVSGEFFAVTGRQLVVGETVRFGGTMPTTNPAAQLVAGTNYYVHTSSSDWFGVAATPGGELIDLTNVGANVTYQSQGVIATRLGYGIMERLRVVNTTCDHNGQALTQLANPEKSPQTATYTTTTTLPCAPADTGKRYRLNPATDTTFNIPLSTKNGSNATNTIIHIARQAGSAGVPRLTFDPNDVITSELPSGMVVVGTLSGGGYVNCSIDLATVSGFQIDLNLVRIRETTGGWHINGWGNGEGFDGAGAEFNFINVSCSRNQGTGLQWKPVSGTERPTGITFIGCLAYENGANGISLVNETTGTRLGVISDVTFESCHSVGNREAGLNLTTQQMVGITVNACMIRSNQNGGLDIKPYVRDVRVTSSHFRGNGTGHDYHYNMVIDSATNVLVDGCSFSGVDSEKQNLLTRTQMDAPGAARCVGMFIRNNSTLGGKMYRLTNCVLGNNSFHNHYGGSNIVYYDTTTAGPSTDTNFYTDYPLTSLRETGYPRHKRRIQLPSEDAIKLTDGTPLGTASGADLGYAWGDFTNRTLGYITGEAMSGAGTKQQSCRWRVYMPQDYVTGNPINIACVANEDLSTTPYSVLTLSVLAKTSTAGWEPAQLSLNLCSANAQNLSVTAGWLRWAIPSATIVPGQMIEIALQLDFTRTTGANTQPTIHDVWLEY